MPSNVFTEMYCVLHDARSIIAIVRNERANCIAPKGMIVAQTDQKAANAF